MMRASLEPYIAPDLTPECLPYARSFKRSSLMFSGCGNHFGYHPNPEEAASCGVEVQTIPPYIDDDKVVYQIRDGRDSSNGNGDWML